MNEQRSNQRHHLGVDIDLINRENGEALGRLCDVSPQGLMIISDDCPQIGAEFEVVIQVPEEGTENLELTVTCRWARLGEVEDSFEAGFLVEEITSDQLLALSTLAQKYDFFGTFPDLQI